MGKGSGRREGANDAAFKAAAWPGESPHVRVHWRSECCEAKPLDQVSDDGAGHCSKCGEPTQFFREYN
jgi:hypothetical protein